jgi:hypothetical protein
LRLAHEAPWYMMRLAGQAQHRRSRLNSNVRPHTTPRPMTKRNALLLLLICLFGYLTLIWATYSLTTDAYDYWKNGHERIALVLKHDHTSGTVRGGTTYYYEVALGDRRFVTGFPSQLSVGKSYSVLEVPGKPGLTLGNSQSGIFAVFAAQIGGYLMPYLIAMFIPFAVAVGPFALVRMAGAARAL